MSISYSAKPRARDESKGDLGEEMADTSGGVPNQWDAFFDELERWEAVLSALPDVSDDLVDVMPVVDDPPG